MAQTLNYTRIPAPRVSLVDPQTGIVSNEWFRFFNNLYAISYSGTTTTTAGTYGSATNVAQITINDFGVTTALSNVPIAIDATQIVSGNINTARIQGAYTGITGVGTLTLGTWNATPITTTYGGTGLTSYAAGDLSYYAAGTALSNLAIGSSTYLLTSSGTAPQWTNPTTVTVGKATNVAGGLANQIPYQTAVDTTSFIVAPTVSNTYLNWSGTAFQWTAAGGSMVYPAAGIANSTGSAWGTSYTTSGTGTVVALTDSPTFTTAITSTGALQLTGDATTNQNIATTQTTGTLSIGGTGATGTITLGQSTGVQILNIATGAATGTKTVNIGRLATAGTTSIFLGSVSGANNTISLGGGTSTGTISINNTTGTASTNITTGATLTGVTKTVNIGTAGASGSTTTITIGSAVSGATSTTTNNGLFKLQSYTVATLPTGTVGSKSFVTDALAPTFGAAVVGGGAVGIPVYHDGTSWKVG